MVYEKRSPVFTNPEPIPGCFLRTILNLHHIMPLTRACCKPLQGKFNMNPVLLWDLYQVILGPA